MNLSDLRDYIRGKMRDFTVPPLCAGGDLDSSINEAEREACIRANILEGPLDLEINTSDLRYVLDPRIIDVINIDDFYDEWTLTPTHLVLSRLPVADKTLTLNCYLLPGQKMVNDSDEPEIPEVFHKLMCDWAISLSYGLQDAEMYDQNLSDRYAVKFTQSFGERPNALTLRNRLVKRSRAVEYNWYI